MGSDSDLPVMKESADVLEELGISFEILISSAHRVPEKTMNYAKNAASRGIDVIIAGAGGAAHLPGVIAAFTPLPVIGVPIYTSSLGGLDSLYSIVQMPAGIPVAAVAINGARNAGILAAQIIGVKDPEIRKKIENFKAELAAKVEKKGQLLEQLGCKEYIRKFF
ncbi:MAG: 5-(carboxyamino)imidazole ribonucleotide mutase [Firmicutes bacterium HGW-Firmicutes-13]|nr:MAG: 5-(carboxyamino)imidazole ribonucleotide mutase [Firmicutes bacterium HGW-Firmicutes-13]